MPVHHPYVAPEVVKAIRMLWHLTIGTIPHNNPLRDFTEMPTPPSAFVGLEGLDIWAKRALVLQLVPLGSFRLPQSFGQSRGHQQRVSPGEASLSQQTVALKEGFLLDTSATVQLKVLRGPLLIYPSRATFACFQTFPCFADFKENQLHACHAF